MYIQQPLILLKNSNSYITGISYFYCPTPSSILYGTNEITWQNNTVSWYIDNWNGSGVSEVSAGQYNCSGGTYFYSALG